MTSGLFAKPEAKLFAERCISLGVPEDSLFTEEHSTNTGENFCFSRHLLSSLGFFPSTGLVTCKPYMAKRVWATGTKQWSRVNWFVSTPPLSFEEYPSEETPLGSTLQLMVGDLQRCRVYAELGYQVPVHVPDDIWSAGMRLAEAGYDQYFIR